MYKHLDTYPWQECKDVEPPPLTNFKARLGEHYSTGGFQITEKYNGADKHPEVHTVRRTGWWLRYNEWWLLDDFQCGRLVEVGREFAVEAVSKLKCTEENSRSGQFVLSLATIIQVWSPLF